MCVRYKNKHRPLLLGIDHKIKMMKLLPRQNFWRRLHCLSVDVYSNFTCGINKRYLFTLLLS